MNKIDTRISLVQLFGDQCGGPPRQEGKTLMLDQVAYFAERLKEITGIEFVFDNRDISAEARYTAIANGKHEKVYREMCERILELGIALKAPTETSKPSQVAERIEEMSKADDAPNFDPEDPEKMKEYRRSPNDVFRNGVKACAIVRDHEPLPNLYEKPRVSQNLDIMTPDLDGYMEYNEAGEPVRKISKEDLEDFASSVAEKAKKEGKHIVIMGKYTISAFEEAFTAAVEAAANELDIPTVKKLSANSGNPEKIRQLSDSGLPWLVREGYDNQIIACLPDVADRMQMIADINPDDIAADEDVIRDMKPMRVFRVATGFGYGGELAETEEGLSETYVMDKQAVNDCSRLAVSDACKLGINEITVVLPHPQTNHPINQSYIETVIQNTDDLELNIVTCGEMFRDITTNPADDRYQIVICGNADGDHITDLVPALQVGKLEEAILGVGESRIIAIDPNDENVKIIAWIAEASAGTAPTLEPPERNNEILSAGILLALCRLLAEHPDLEDCHGIGKLVHDSINHVLNETGVGRSDWSDLAKEAFEYYKSIAA